MRAYRPIPPPKDMDPRVYKVLENHSEYLQQVSAGMRRLGRGESPDQAGETIIVQQPGITDHGELDGLTSIVNAGITVDYNDDHPQHALLAGRTAGQYLYGSRGDEDAGTWNPGGTVLTGVDATDDNDWTTGTIDRNVPVGYTVFAVSSTSFFDGAAGVIETGDTSYHSTFTDGASNTWTKLKEVTMKDSGSNTGRTVSIWYTIVTTAMTSGSTTFSTTYATETEPTWPMNRKAMEAFAFNVGAGSTINLVDSISSEQDAAAQPDALTRTGTGETLYLRGLMQNPTSGAFNPEVFTPTGGFTPFTTDHSGSTHAPGELGHGARGEFIISGAGQTSQPTVDLGGPEVYDFASYYLALQLSKSTPGTLNLSSIKQSLAANILMQGSTIYANMDFLYFRDAGGTVNLSHIRGSDGAFVGPVVLTTNLDLDGNDIIDCGNIFFAADDTYDIGTTTVSPKVIYSRGISVGSKATQTVPSSFNPNIIDEQASFDAKTLDALRIIVENTSVAVDAKSRNLYLEQNLRNGLDGVMIELNRVTANVATAILPAAINLVDTYSSGEVSTAIGASFVLSTSGGSPATSLTALVLGASGASSTNYALLASDGDIIVDSDSGAVVFGEGQNASILYDTTNLVVNPQLVGSGDLKLAAGDFIFAAGTQKVGDTENQNLLDKTAAESLSGVYTWTAGSIDLDDNVELRFGTGNDTVFDFNGSDMIIVPTGRFWVQGKSQFSTGSVTDTSDTNWALFQPSSNSATESSSTIHALNAEALFQAGVNRGRNFSKHIGVKGEARYARTNGITWASNIPNLVGGEFRASYANTGVLVGSIGSIKMHGGEFVAEARANPSGAMIIAELWGGNFRAIATTAMANLTITDVAAGRFDSDVSGAGTVTRNYGILVENIVGGSTNFGINVDGADVQISSDNYLLLEGSATAKGDTGLRWNSGTSDMEFDVNGTTELLLDATGLTINTAGVLFFKETTTPTAVPNYGALYTKSNNELFFQDGAGVEHLLHGDAFSNIWFHNASSVEVTIAAQDAFTKIDSFTVVGKEDDLANVIGSVSTNDLTLSAIAGGEYELSYHASVTATGGADKEMLIAMGITLATPLDITDVTDDTITPIVITSTAHGLEDGDMVEIAGVVGNTAANGSFIVDNKTTDTFEIVALDGTATTGNGDYDAGTPTGDVTIDYVGNMVVHREVRGSTLGAVSATGIHTLANSDKLAVYVANLDGTTNLTVAAVSFDAFRIGD